MSERAKYTILCVDDEPDIVSSLYDTFIDTYNVKTASSGTEALSIFHEEDIALVITDQRMPTMQGAELLAKINAEKPYCIKILLTGYADINAAVDAINKGSVDKYFSKPWDEDELVKTVEAMLLLYEIDAYCEKNIKQGRNIETIAEHAHQFSGLFEQFLNSYPFSVDEYERNHVAKSSVLGGPIRAEHTPAGVCLVGGAGTIEFVNKAGLALLQYMDLANIIGKDFKDVFLLDEKTLHDFHEHYLQNDLTADELDVRLEDGTGVRIRAGITFAAGEGSAQVNGIVFKKM